VAIARRGCVRSGTRRARVRQSPVRGSDRTPWGSQAIESQSGSGQGQRCQGWPSAKATEAIVARRSVPVRRSSFRAPRRHIGRRCDARANGEKHRLKPNSSRRFGSWSGLPTVICVTRSSSDCVPINAERCPSRNLGWRADRYDHSGTGVELHREWIPDGEAPVDDLAVL